MDIIVRLCENEIITPVRSIRPEWYDKLLCIKSLFQSIENARPWITSVTLIHDGASGPLLDSIASSGYTLIKLDAGNNEACLQVAYWIADQLSNDLCFVEDDYLHLPNSMQVMAAALPRFGLISGYDNPDRYTLTDDIEYTRDVAWDEPSQKHWRTAESNCATYAISRDIWNQFSQKVKSFGILDRPMFRWFHSIGIPLWTPLPGVYTHCQQRGIQSGLSHGVDWQSVNNDLS
jgi:hypothetical protein